MLHTISRCSIFKDHLPPRRSDLVIIPHQFRFVNTFLKTFLSFFQAFSKPFAAALSARAFIFYHFIPLLSRGFCIFSLFRPFSQSPPVLFRPKCSKIYRRSARIADLPTEEGHHDHHFYPNHTDLFTFNGGGTAAGIEGARLGDLEHVSALLNGHDYLQALRAISRMNFIIS